MSDDNVSLGLAHEAEVMLRKAGATRENFWKPISKSEDLARRVYELVSHRPTYSIIVNYKRSFKDMIEAGHYDEVDSNININRKHLLIKNRERNKKEHLKERLLTFFHFKRDIRSDDAISEIKRQGYRLALIEELLTLGERRPDIQREYPIVSLELFDNLQGFLCLSGNDSFRRLGFQPQDFYWGYNCRFAAIRE